MERGATANVMFIFPESVDFDSIEAIRLYVCGAGSGVKVIKERGDIEFLDGKRISVRFSQEDTLSFNNGEDVRIQWHWRDKSGEARVSKIIETDIYEFLGSEPV